MMDHKHLDSWIKLGMYLSITSYPSFTGCYKLSVLSLNIAIDGGSLSNGFTSITDDPLNVSS